jgi:4-amino-4-deoxy-L-arabinose transferase-like glycosyltransferase
MGAYGLALIARRMVAAGVWLGTGVGLGFVVKGLFAPVLFLLATIILVVSCEAWRNRKALVSASIAAASALPWITIWPASLYAHAPSLFNEWLLNDELVRFWTEDFAVRAQLWHYVSIMPWYAWPSLPLALWVLWGTRVSRFARPAIQLPVVLFVVSMIVLGVCADARELRAMPLLIPLALLATPAVDSLRRGASNAFYWFSVMGFAFFALVIWVYWSGLELGMPVRLSAHLHRMQPAYESHVRIVPLIVAVMYCTAFILMLLRLKRSVERPVIVWAAGTALVWAMLMSLFVDFLDIAKSYRGMAVALERALPAHADCITSRGLGESQRALLHYHAGILTHREEAPSRQRACDLLLIQGRRTAPPEIPPGWHQVWEGTRPGEKHEYFWLYAYGPPPPL